MLGVLQLIQVGMLNEISGGEGKNLIDFLKKTN